MALRQRFLFNALYNSRKSYAHYYASIPHKKAPDAPETINLLTFYMQLPVDTAIVTNK